MLERDHSGRYVATLLWANTCAIMFITSACITLLRNIVGRCFPAFPDCLQGMISHASTSSAVMNIDVHPSVRAFRVVLCCVTHIGPNTMQLMSIMVRTSMLVKGVLSGSSARSILFDYKNGLCLHLALLEKGHATCLPSAGADCDDGLCVRQLL